MSDLGATTIDRIWLALPDSRAQVRVGQHVIAKAVTSGIPLERDAGELGTFDSSTATVRYKAADEDPRNPVSIGKPVEINHTGEWVQMRVMGKKTAAGATTLRLQTLYEQ